jgi:hypothetical protein
MTISFNVFNIFQVKDRILFLPTGLGTVHSAALVFAVLTPLFIPAPYQFLGFFVSVVVQLARFSLFFFYVTALTILATKRLDLLSMPISQNLWSAFEKISNQFKEKSYENNFGFRSGEENLQGAIAAYYGLLAFRKNLFFLLHDLFALYIAIAYLPAGVAMLYIAALLVTEIRVLRFLRFQEVALSGHIQNNS